MAPYPEAYDCPRSGDPVWKGDKGIFM